MRNDVQLITYADRLAGDLPGLTAMLAGPLDGLFGGVHVLPFFDPIDGSDAGFDPIDHREVDPRIGSWEDIDELGRRLPLMADLIVNHVSALSPQFKDFLAKGDASEHAGMFLTFDKVFPNGATEAELARLYRPRPGLPLTPVVLADRTRRIVWSTFTQNQIDIDVNDAAGRRYIDSILDRFSAHGIKAVRLDAVGYAVKTAGTSGFMTPETFDFIDELTAHGRRRGIEVLVEVHSYWKKQVEIAAKVDWVYDFALPPLVLHGLYSGSAERLAHWFRIRPQNAITVLDTHDGIGVIDVGPDTTEPDRPGLLDIDEIDALVDGIHDASMGGSRLATGAAASNVDLYQVNCTFYDALGAEDDAYLIARLLQLWLPGIPQIYYVGLLAGHNDLELLQRTSVGRDINRHYYRDGEVEQALQRPVVQRLCEALKLRNTHPAFTGAWELLDEPGGAGELAMRWTAGDDRSHLAELRVDLEKRTYELTVTAGDERHTVTDLLELAAI